jgi:hypothetical protein
MVEESKNHRSGGEFGHHLSRKKGQAGAIRVRIKTIFNLYRDRGSANSNTTSKTLLCCKEGGTKVWCKIISPFVKVCRQKRIRNLAPPMNGDDPVCESTRGQDYNPKSSKTHCSSCEMTPGFFLTIFTNIVEHRTVQVLRKA